MKLRCDQVQSTTLGISSLSSRGKIISLACLSRLLSVIQPAFPASSSSRSPCPHSTFGLTTGLSSETRSQGRAGWGRPRPAALERPGLPRNQEGTVLTPHRAIVRELFRKGGQALSPETKMGAGPKSRVRRGPVGTQLGKDCCRSRMPVTASLLDKADPATPGPQLGPPHGPPGPLRSLPLPSACAFPCWVSWLVLAGPAGPCSPRSTWHVPPRCPAGERALCCLRECAKQTCRPLVCTCDAEKWNVFI